MKDKKLGKKEIDEAMILYDKLGNQIMDTIIDFQKENAVGVGFVMTALLQFTADYCKLTTQKTLEFINTRFAEIDAENNKEA